MSLRRLKDDPERDVNVQAVHGFDVTSLSVEDLAARGVRLHGRPVTVTKGEHRFYMTHSQFLADVRQAWDVTDRGIARAAVADHARRLAERVDALRTRALAAESEDPTVATQLREQADELEAHPLRGLTLQRSFPCLGILRVEDETSRMRAVQCDVCGFRCGITVPKEEREPDDSDGEDGTEWAKF